MLERVIAAAVDITPAEKGNIQLRDDDNVLTIELIRTLRETVPALLALVLSMVGGSPPARSPNSWAAA